MDALGWIRVVVHYGLHVGAPALLAMALFPRHRFKRAYLPMLCTLVVDADHLLASPIFDPDRCSIGFHPLHSYPAIAVYIALCMLPYRRLGWPWWIRAVGVGLAFHMLTDWQDYYLWGWMLR